MPDIPGETTVQAEIPAQSVPILPTAKSRPYQSQQEQGADPSRAATTTFQEDLTTAGQRRINLIWEYTQAIIAILVVTATMISGIYSMIYTNVPVPTIMSVAFGTVVGFYFARTNHQAIGGTGPKPIQVYEGR